MFAFLFDDDVGGGNVNVKVVALVEFDVFFETDEFFGSFDAKDVSKQG